METFFKNLTAEDGSKDKFVRDLRTLVHDAETLIRSTGHQLPVKTQEELLSALKKLNHTCQKVENEAILAAQQADRMIRAHPYRCLGIAFGAGLFFGLLNRRR